RDHREDLAVLRVHRNADGLREAILLDTLAKLGVEKLLEFVVDGEDEVVADRRRGVRERLDLALRRVPLDLAPAVLAAQVLLVFELESGATNDVGREVALVLQVVQLVLGDRSDIAEERRVQRR